MFARRREWRDHKDEYYGWVARQKALVVRPVGTQVDFEPQGDEEDAEEADEEEVTDEEECEEVTEEGKMVKRRRKRKNRRAAETEPERGPARPSVVLYEPSEEVPESEEPEEPEPEPKEELEEPEPEPEPKGKGQNKKKKEVKFTGLTQTLGQL
jgi:hypothetical protein